MDKGVIGIVNINSTVQKKHLGLYFYALTTKQKSLPCPQMTSLTRFDCKPKYKVPQKPQQTYLEKKVEKNKIKII